jgi:hypothetical protein
MKTLSVLFNPVRQWFIDNPLASIVLALVVGLGLSFYLESMTVAAGLVLAMSVGTAAPVPQGFSAIFQSPNNLWKDGVQRSVVRSGVQGYNNIPDIEHDLYMDTLFLHGDVTGGAQYMETMIPGKIRQVDHWIHLRKEQPTLDIVFKSRPIADSFGGVINNDANERVAQGIELEAANNLARNAVRSVFGANFFTSLQAQTGDQPNPNNGQIVSVIGLPVDIEAQMQVGDIFGSTATTFQVNDDPDSTTMGKYLWSDGRATSPTSLASNTDQSNATINQSYVSGVTYRKGIGAENLTYIGSLPPDQFDIAARRRRGVFIRISDYGAILGNPEIAAIAGVSQASTLISAGFGTNATTPSTTIGTQAVAVTGEVIIPYIPVGTHFLRLFRMDLEASSPKRNYVRDGVIKDDYVGYARLGLCGGTDFAILKGQVAMEKRALKRQFAAQFGDIYGSESYFDNGVRGFNDAILGISRGADGSIAEPLGGVTADFVNDVMMLTRMQMVRLMLQMRALGYFYQSGKQNAPTMTPLYNTAANLSAMAFNTRAIPSPLGFNLDGSSRLDGSLANGAKAGFATKGLANRVPLQNHFSMPQGTFSFGRLAEISSEIIIRGGGTQFDILTDPMGALGMEEYFLEPTPKHPTPVTEEVGSFATPNVNYIQTGAVNYRVIILPELRYSNKGGMILVNPGTANAPNLLPLYVRDKMFITGNDAPAGAMTRAYGLHGELGLAMRGELVNLFAITRN